MSKTSKKGLGAPPKKASRVAGVPSAKKRTASRPSTRSRKKENAGPECFEFKLKNIDLNADSQLWTWKVPSERQTEKDLRDMFAARAMQAMLHDQRSVRRTWRYYLWRLGLCGDTGLHSKWMYSTESLAKQAYITADAMMAERNPIKMVKPCK